VSEWLRRWTRNPLGFARRGSNPLGVAFVAIEFYLWSQDTLPGNLFDLEPIRRNGPLIQIQDYPETVTATARFHLSAAKKACVRISQNVYLEPKWLRCFSHPEDTGNKISGGRSSRAGASSWISIALAKNSISNNANREQSSSSK
jgi:hypothetical protein